jgi:hypothetical protein
MNDFTEDDLSRALGDQIEKDVDPVTKDLLEEENQENQDEQQPADADPKADDAADPDTGDQKPDDANPDQPDKKDPDPDAKADPAKGDEPADTEPKDTEPADTEPELIMGKFKNQDALIEAYKNLEKKLGEKSQETQEIKQVTSDEFDLAVKQKIAEENWKIVDKAFDTIANPEDAKEAQFLLNQFKKTGDGAYLEQARGYLDKRIDRKLEVDTMNMAATITQRANARRQEILLKPLSDELDKMAEEDPEFMNDEQNQNLMAMAIKLNPATVNVRAVKKEIQSYGKSQYDKGYEAAKKEFAKQVEQKAVSVKTTPKATPAPAPKKDISDMSIEDQLKDEYKDMELF